MALLLTCGDGEERGEVYGCAADRQQASIVFEVAADMVRMCPALNKRVKILASQKRIVYQSTNSFYQVLSAEAYSKHGFNIHGVVFDELHTQPNRKLFDVMTKPLTYIKYAVLLLAVVLLPVLIVNDLGMGDPYFCKYICPQGVLEGALPLSAVNEGIRSALGKLFSWKLVVLISVVVLSVLFYRPFCKWICPLGAFYALFNKVSCMPTHLLQQYGKTGNESQDITVSYGAFGYISHDECVHAYRI